MLKLILTDTKQLPLLIKSIQEFFLHENILQTEEKITHAGRNLILNPNLGKAWLIALHEDVIGHCILTFSYDIEFAGNEAWITDLFLYPQFRGKKYGKKVMDLILEEAKKLSLGAVHLQVRRDNEQARKLYVDCGFVEVPRLILSREIK